MREVAFGAFGMDRCALAYVTWMTNRTPASTGSPAQGHWQPGGRGVWGRGTHVCMAEALCCPPETVSALLISYAPIEN